MRIKNMLGQCPFKIGDAVSYGGMRYGGRVIRIEDCGDLWQLDVTIGGYWSVDKDDPNWSGMRLWTGECNED
jgi:hypothetical protein